MGRGHSFVSKCQPVNFSQRTTKSVGFKGRQEYCVQRGTFLNVPGVILTLLDFPLTHQLICAENKKFLSSASGESSLVYLSKYDIGLGNFSFFVCRDDLETTIKFCLAFLSFFLSVTCLKGPVILLHYHSFLKHQQDIATFFLSVDGDISEINLVVYNQPLNNYRQQKRS